MTEETITDVHSEADLSGEDPESRPRPQWRREKLVFDGDDYFEQLIHSIDQAERSVDFEVYIFSHDEVGIAVSESLARAASRGVKVRLLVDGVGSLTWIGKQGSRLFDRGVRIRVFHPIYKISSIAKWFWHTGFRGSTHDERRKFFWRLNRRTHRKLCVVDHEHAWVGSMNVCSTHCHAPSRAHCWRDTAARVEGLGIRDLEIAFEYAWVRSHSLAGKRQFRDQMIKRLIINPLKAAVVQSSELVRLNYTLRLRRNITRDLLDRISNAKSRIWLTTPYLAPPASILRALARASNGGVDVRILVPRKSDVFFMPWIANAFYRPLIEKNVKIYEYLPRFLHAKCMIIDDWAIIGTSNMNRRSLIHDLEVDVVISHPETREELTNQFLRDLKSTEEIHKNSPWYNRWIGRILSYLLKDLI